jgi:CIC family chloride channel protein
MDGSPVISEARPVEAARPPAGDAAAEGAAKAWASRPSALGRLRALVRDREVMLMPLSAVIGVIAALAVAGMSWAAQSAHVALFGLPLDQRLSAGVAVSPAAAIAVPLAGGCMLAAMDWLRRRWKLAPAADPVEANALRGGDLSLRDSLVVSAQTLLSNGCGASVGLEAGYAQIGAGLAAAIGRAFKLRRRDRRLVLGCGVAAAIGAAFNAPLAGALYACELVLGAYSVRSAGPIFTAAITASLLTAQLGGNPYALHAAPGVGGGWRQVLALTGLALVTALTGIGVMKLAAAADRGLKRCTPAAARPALGGAFVGLLAAATTPQVLAAGHGAMALDLELQLGVGALLGLIALKLVACVVSLASGFRGGLFFASLFVGTLIGKAYATLFTGPASALGSGLDPVACAVAGMAGLGAAIVGAPLTMVFLVLEMTHSFAAAVAALPVCIIASAFVRSAFGHSFSTWRLHLQGETIRGAEDVGWLRGLRVGSMMRRDVATMRAEATIGDCRRALHLGSHRAVFVTDAAGAYLGVALLSEIFAARFDGDLEASPVLAAARHPELTLSPEMNVVAAMKLFEAAEADVLAVVDGSHAVVGFLTEAFARRRYMQELEAATGGFAAAT